MFQSVRAPNQTSTGRYNMNTQPIPSSAAFVVPPWILQTFATPPRFFRVSGPGTLVRLVQFGKTTYDGLDVQPSRLSGEFWFEEDLLLRLMHQARASLTQQQATSGRPFSASLPSLIGMYVRHCLRGDLAICKDWTNDFDGFVRLRLMSANSLTALVGPVARQAAYSPDHPQHQAVVASDIWLAGQATQYVIDFKFRDNRPYVGHILGPFRF